MTKKIGSIFRSRFELLLKVIKIGIDNPSIMEKKPDEILSLVIQRLKKKDKKVDSYIQNHLGGGDD
jgi:hypothetical protein